MTTTELPKRKMRFSQFSFRQLFVLFLAVAVFLRCQEWTDFWEGSAGSPGGHANPSRALLLFHSESQPGPAVELGLAIY